MAVKICAISDLHGTLPETPPCDVLVIAGDICPVWNHELEYQQGWLRTEFLDWLYVQPAKEVAVCGGNHDWIAAQPDFKKKFSYFPWWYLQDSGVTLCGLNFWGTPWQPPFCDWAFNAPEEERKKYFSLIPNDTDILISHCPPYGIGDYAHSQHLGCRHLLAKVEQVKPKAHIFGHIHEGRGSWDIGGTKFINATIVDGQYRHVYKPVEFTIND